MTTAGQSSLLLTRDYGPGCPRHEGDPHNLCEACWALEPDPVKGCAACDGDPEAHGLHVCGKEPFS